MIQTLDIVTFFSDDMVLNTIDHNNINLDNDNFDNDDPETNNHVRLMAWCIQTTQGI